MEEKEPVMQINHEKRLRIFTIVYLIAAAILLVFMACELFVLIQVNQLQPTFTNYGSGDVEGWATIVSGIGFIAGWTGKAIVAIMEVIFAVVAAYWGIGIVLDLILFFMVRKNKPFYKGTGIALGIWTILPGGILLISVPIALIDGNIEAGSIALMAVIAAAFIAAGVFLLVSLKGERRQNA